MRVLVVSPHPDDEAIGCGGAIRKHVLDGDEVHVLYLTSGEQGCPGEDPATVGALRETEAGLCSQVLETQQLTFWREPDGALRVSEELVKRLRMLVWVEHPDLIYAPHGDEGHRDHVAAAELVWLLGESLPRCRLYEIWTPMHKVAELVDITPYASTKRAAIRAHRSQAMRNGFDEAILALNHYRGLLYGPNMMYAEAFGAFGSIR